MPDLPSGTVTFLFTDIEGSTRLWEQYPDAMRLVLARHNALLTEGIVQHGGLVVKSRGEGDSFFAVFSRAADALTAAAALQQALLAEPWPTETPLRVRMALHTGEADLQGGDYYGPAVNRCARLRAVAHGGQVLLSQTTADRVREHLAAGMSLRDLGSHRLKDLQQPEHLFQLLHPSLPPDFPPLRSLEAFAHNLPVQLTSFIGRQEAMTEIKRLLTTTHLLTLTGSGGCGKTRLTLQVAADLVEEYADGVWLVELAALADPALVPQAVATALGVREEPGRPLTATLTDHLRSRSLLLVLDNCEHLLSSSAQLVESLLRACPALRVLASSREGLGVVGEQTYRVPSLSLPDPRHLPGLEKLQEFEAVRLFAERAGLSRPGFAVTEANAASVAQVCQRLDGIPLAIELAAARLKALPVEQIATRMDDRFRLLTGGSRTALPRQQTLRALIDWSYDLLSEPERALLRRLSVFSGGWTLVAAEAVCSGLMIDDCRLMIEGTPDPSPISNHQSSIINPEDVLDLLTALVEKSLVVYEEQSGAARYRLLETVRQYARDRQMESGGAAATRDRHLEFFLRFAEDEAPKRIGADVAASLERLETDFDNVRTALAWAAESGAVEFGLRLVVAAADFFWVRDHWAEGWSWLEGMLAHPGARARTLARGWALAHAGMTAAWALADFKTAQPLFEESLGIAEELGDKRLHSLALLELGQMARERGELETARALKERALVAARELGDKVDIAAALGVLATNAHRQGENETARSLYDESLSLLQELGNKGMLWVCGARVDLALDEGDDATAHSLAEKGLADARELGYRSAAALFLRAMGRVAANRGDYPSAWARWQESLALELELGNKPNIPSDLENLAGIAAAEGKTERAIRLWGAAAALRAAMGDPRPMRPPRRADYERQVEAARVVLGEAAFAAAWTEGHAMTLEDAITEALKEAADD